MRNRRTYLMTAFAAAIVPAVLYGNAANPDGPPIKRTGAAVDGGITCSACHRAGASLDGGRVTIRASDYKPGQKQMIHVRVEHPQSTRWGFQLTARLASDPSKKAGVFTATDMIRVRCDDPAAARGTAAPCGTSVLEFAAHTLASSSMGSNGRAEYHVEWTAPATDVGQVIFYASGNAANLSGNTQGDRIYTTSKTIQYDYGCTSSTRPTISAVVNGASGSTTLGWNSMISVFGTGFAPAGRSREARSDDFSNDRLPGDLACVSVYVDDKKIPLTYVSETQINAQIPANSAIDTGNVKVTVGLKSGEMELKSDDKMVPFQVATPSFFTFNGRSIAGRLLDWSIMADPAVVPGGKTAKAGDIVVLYGNGFGVTEPFYLAGEVLPEVPAQLPRLKDAVTVIIGGMTLASEDVLYAGLTPGAISALYQFNIRLPASLTPGEVPVVIRVRGVETQQGATIPVR